MKRMHLLLILLLTLSSVSRSQNPEPVRYLLPVDTIFSIMETSMLTYQPDIVDAVEGIKKDYSKLSDQLYLSVSSDSSVTLYKYDLSGEALKYYDMAEAEYKNKNYDKAITWYREVLRFDPSYHKAYTMIGDMHYMKNECDSAGFYFTQAISKNFADYTAHWFLADNWVKLGEMEKALEEITIAHLLNRNHGSILDRLKSIRKANNREWKDWAIEPECRSYKEEDNYVIETTTQWLCYAVTEALWKYEPGFSAGILGKRYEEGDVSYEKEAACIFANINSVNMEKVRQIANDGYFQEMIWYERLSRFAPAALLLIPRPFFLRIMEYVNKYH